jgi:transcription antitermination factor NusG
MERWYVAVVEPQREWMVAKRLARPDPFSGRPEFQVLWPHFKVSRMLNRRIIEEPRSMFPGYVFFRADCSDSGPGHWKLINGMWGVVGLLPRHLDFPLAVPDELVDLLQRCTVGGETKLSLDQFVKALNRYFKEGVLALDVPKDDPFCQVGYQVRIASGPFAGRVGECSKADAQTATLDIWCFGSSVKITVLQAQLGPDKWKKTQEVDRPSRKSYIRRQEKRVAKS